MRTLPARSPTHACLHARTHACLRLRCVHAHTLAETLTARATTWGRDGERKVYILIDHAGMLTISDSMDADHSDIDSIIHRYVCMVRTFSRAISRPCRYVVLTSLSVRLHATCMPMHADTFRCMFSPQCGAMIGSYASNVAVLVHDLMFAERAR